MTAAARGAIVAAWRTTARSSPRSFSPPPPPPHPSRNPPTPGRPPPSPRPGRRSSARASSRPSTTRRAAAPGPAPTTSPSRASSRTRPTRASASSSSRTAGTVAGARPRPCPSPAPTSTSAALRPVGKTHALRLVAPAPRRRARLRPHLGGRAHRRRLGEPRPLPAPVNAPGVGWNGDPSVTRDGTLYFSSDRDGSGSVHVYRSRFAGGAYAGTREARPRGKLRVQRGAAVRLARRDAPRLQRHRRGRPSQSPPARGADRPGQAVPARRPLGEHRQERRLVAGAPPRPRHQHRVRGELPLPLLGRKDALLLERAEPVLGADGAPARLSRAREEPPFAVQWPRKHLHDRRRIIGALAM